MFIKPDSHKITSFYGLVIALACLLLLTNCQSVTSHDSSDVTDLVTLTDALRREGATVAPVGNITQPFLSVTGTESEVNGEPIQIFEYPDNTTLQQDVANIQPDGAIKGFVTSWTDQPHFYQTEQMLVIYDGSNEVVLSLLETVLGAPFAVGKPASSAGTAGIFSADSCASTLAFS